MIARRCRAAAASTAGPTRTSRGLFSEAAPDQHKDHAYTENQTDRATDVTQDRGARGPRVILAGRTRFVLRWLSPIVGTTLWCVRSHMRYTSSNADPRQPVEEDAQTLQSVAAAR
jgi:hypothetical protein